MGFLGALAAPIASAIFGGVGSLLGLGGSSRVIRPLPQATTNTARQQVDRQDALRKRRGASADMITGVRGAEAPGSSVGKLIIGS